MLSIDGGGVRGILAACLLDALERKLRRASGRPDARLAEFFDLVAGTSTGALLACLYLCPHPNVPRRARYSAADALAFYQAMAPEVFALGVWRRIRTAGGLLDEIYPNSGLDGALRKLVGDLRLARLLKPCLLTAYDIERRKTHFFTSRDAAARPEKDFLVRDAARAATASPTYFEPARVRSAAGAAYSLIDGGVFACNPALCAYAEARGFPGRPTAADMALISIGTGRRLKPYSFEAARNWGRVRWVGPLLDIMASATVETVDFVVRKLFEASRAGGQYVRIEPELGRAASAMDDATASNLRLLLDAGRAAARRHGAELDRAAALLAR